MKADFPALWAESPGTLRREPTPAELAGGFPCGPLDLQLWNELMFRLSEVQREIVYAVTQSGQTPNAGNTTQLWGAINKIVPVPVALWHSGTGGGTASAITVSDLAPAIDAYADRLAVMVTMPFANANGATIKIGSLPAIPLLRNNGTPVVAGDAPAGCDMLVALRLAGGGSARLIGFGRAEVQQIVTNVTLYVRTDGSDANDGSYNGAGGAFQTMAAAFASAIRFSNTSTVSVQLGTPGTYAAPGTLPKTGASFQILGDANGPANYNVSGAGSFAQPPILVAGASLLLNGVQVNNTGTINNTLGANLGGSITTNNTILTSAPGNPNFHMAAFAGGSIVSSTGTVFASSMGGAVSANGGSIVLSGQTANNPNWTTGGVAAVSNGNVSLIAGSSFVGSATGRRYYVTTNGVISTNGAGENYFPGDTAGLKDSGGQYV